MPVVVTMCMVVPMIMVIMPAAAIGVMLMGRVLVMVMSMVVAAATGIMLMRIAVGLRMIFGFSGQRAGHVCRLPKTKALSFRR